MMVVFSSQLKKQYIGQHGHRLDFSSLVGKKNAQKTPACKAFCSGRYVLSFPGTVYTPNMFFSQIFHAFFPLKLDLASKSQQEQSRSPTNSQHKNRWDQNTQELHTINISLPSIRLSMSMGIFNLHVRDMYDIMYSNIQYLIYLPTFGIIWVALGVHS